MGMQCLIHIREDLVHSNSCLVISFALDEGKGGGDENQPPTLMSKVTEGGGGASKEAEEEEGEEQYHYVWGPTTPMPAEGRKALAFEPQNPTLRPAPVEIAQSSRHLKSR